MISELRFIRTACGLSEPEFKPIVHQAACLVKELATRFANAELEQHKNRKKLAQAKMEVPAEPAAPNSLTPLVKGLTESVRSHVTQAQWSRFQAESSKRRAHRKRVAIANMVAQLDFHLLLSDDQRERVSASLAARWDDSWTKFVLVTSDNDDQQFPPIPDACIVPFLTERQKTLWHRFPKQAADGSAGLAQLAAQLAGDQASEFDAELGKPRVDPEAGGSAVGRASHSVGMTMEQSLIRGLHDRYRP